MKAMVFAAGRGERLRPLTESVPKALVPVAGRPMIEYPLRLLRHYGIREIIINVHHLGDQIEAYLRDGSRLGLEIVYSREKALLDTGGGLLQARELLADGTFVVLNCDVMIDLALDEALSRHRDRRATATLVLREDPRADSFGPIEAAADGRIQKFLRYARPGRAPDLPVTKFMFTGVHVLEPALFEQMATEPSAKFGITTSTYPHMLLAGAELYGHPFRGYWQDLGVPERIREAEENLRRGKVRLHYL